MKRFILLTAITAASLSAFSQESTLRPTVVVNGKDTLIAFTVYQAKDIAKKISNGIYCKLQMEVCEQTLALSDSLGRAQEKKALLMETKNNNTEKQLNNVGVVNDALKSDIVVLKKELFRQKVYKYLAVTGAIAIGVLSLFF